MLGIFVAARTFHTFRPVQYSAAQCSAVHRLLLLQRQRHFVVACRQRSNMLSMR